MISPTAAGSPGAVTIWGAVLVQWQFGGAALRVFRRWRLRREQTECHQRLLRDSHSTMKNWSETHPCSHDMKNI